MINLLERSDRSQLRAVPYIPRSMSPVALGVEGSTQVDEDEVA